MPRSFQVNGVELARYVVKWNDIEEVKDILLAKATLFVDEYQLTLENSQAQFSPEAKGSFFYGQNIFNTFCQVAVDGVVLFQGYLKDLNCDHQTKTVVFDMQNIFTLPSDTSIPPISLQGVDPAGAILEMINAVGLLVYTDVNSFLAAGAGAVAAGASLNVNIANGSTDSLLTLIQKISELSGIAAFAFNGLITAQAWRPYQGNSAELKQPITPSVVRAFGQRSSAYDAFENQVTVSYGSNSTWTLTDTVSVAQTKITRNYQLGAASTAEIGVPDLVSAQYYAYQYLSRSSNLPVTIQVNLGQQFLEARIGDRFPVTAPNWGLVSAPYEVIETHRKLQENSIQLVLRNLSIPTFF